ncbi:MaoC/PaaZ C-terminal domain-containing protein [Parvularcula dongshanensis]
MITEPPPAPGPDAARFADLIGRRFGPSEWILIDQSRIDAFAEVTDDHQFIHVDPEAAARTPFGTTIAHGFLTLSLLTALMPTDIAMPDGLSFGLNYGFERVRFVAPVRSGTRVRGLATLAAATTRAPGQTLLSWDVTVEAEGSARPALTARWLTLAFG